MLASLLIDFHIPNLIPNNRTNHPQLLLSGQTAPRWTVAAGRWCAGTMLGGLYVSPTWTRSLDVIDAPAHGLDAPFVVLGAPVDVLGAPVDALGAPADVIDAPVDAFGAWHRKPPGTGTQTPGTGNSWVDTAIPRAKVSVRQMNLT